MATTESTPRTGGPQAARPDIVVLVDAASRTERELIEAWAPRVYPGAELVAHEPGPLAGRLERRDDPLIVPARVTWFPSSRAKGSRLGDLRALSPRQPLPALQRIVLRRSPGRAIVTPGEPAHAHALHQEYETETGRADWAGGFAAFVGRRATLAVDRAERPLIGDRYKVPRLVAEQVASSARVRENAAALAAKLGRDPDDVLAELTADLQELVAVQSPPAIDAFRATMAPLHRRAWTVQADVESLEHLRELNRTSALVFLPSHRSYADPLVLADVLDAQRLPAQPRPRRRQHGVLADRAAGQAGRARLHPPLFGDDEVYKLARARVLRPPRRQALQPRVVHRGRPQPHRQAAPAPLRAAALPRRARSRTATARTSRSCRSRSPTTSCRRSPRWPPSRAAARSRPRASAGWPATLRAQRRNVGTGVVRFGEPLSLRRRAGRRRRGQRAGREGRVRISVGHQPRVAGDGDGAGDPRAARACATGALTLEQVREVIAPLLDLLDARGLPRAGGRPARRVGGQRPLATLVRAASSAATTEGEEPV